MVDGELRTTMHERWMTIYASSWISGDIGSFVALFGSDALYQFSPFEAPLQGKRQIEELAQRMRFEQTNKKMTFEFVAGSGPLAVFHWSGGYQIESKALKRNIDGLIVLTLDDVAKCVTFRSWRHIDDSKLK
jgi:hypothetical protein